MLKHLKTCGQTRKHCLASFVASCETNSVSATMFSEVDKQRNIDRKHNVSATAFASFLRALYTTRYIFQLCELAELFTIFEKFKGGERF